MNELLNEYKNVSDKIEKEKNDESDRLFSELAELMLAEEKGERRSAKKDRWNTTYQHKTAMLSLCCLRASINYQLLEMGNRQYEEQLQADLSEITDDVKWLVCSFEINDEAADIILGLLHAIGGISEKVVARDIGYRIKWLRRKKFTESVFHAFNSVSEFFFSQGMESLSDCIIEKVLEISRESQRFPQHRGVVIEILVRWAERLTETAVRVCEKEAAGFYAENGKHCSDFLWFYGCSLEKLQEMESAREILKQCYDLRRKLYGAESWYTMAARREYFFLVWYQERSEEAYSKLLHIIDELEKNDYPETTEEFVKILEGRTLYVVLHKMLNGDNLTEFDHYLSLYERICDEYNESVETTIKKRLSSNFRGGYYLNTGEFILAEKSFLEAIEAECPDCVDNTLSRSQIKTNLLQIYYGQNDQQKFIPLLDELLDILESDDGRAQLTEKDEYRIYTTMVSAQLQADEEISENEIETLKELLYDICTDISEETDNLAECAGEMAVFMLCAIPLLLKNECISEEELRIYQKALHQVENNEKIFPLYSKQQALFYYISAIVSWYLNNPKTEYYIEKSVIAARNSNVPTSSRAGILQTAAAYYGKCGRYDVSKGYLEEALKELTVLWQSFVRYLNDSRLLQILKPTQTMFSSCYAIIRTHENVEAAYEKLLQYKALASMAGKERNRILHTIQISPGLLSKIQNLQNRIAMLETENLLLGTDKEYGKEEKELRELEAEFFKEFPDNIKFTEISLERVKQMMPDNSVTIEYFLCGLEYGNTQLLIPEEQLDETTGIDIYVTCKKEGRCTIQRLTIPDGIHVLENAVEFVDTLQAKSQGNAEIERLERFEDVRNTLYQYLIEPIRSYIEDVEVLYIAPDKHLVNVPFGILHGEDGEMLGDSHSIIAIECARDFLYNNSGYDTNGKTLIIGNPEYHVREIEQIVREDTSIQRTLNIVDGNVPSLPFSELEIRQIGIRTGNEYFSGRKAGKACFLSAQGYENVHVATHGYFEPQAQMETIYSSGLMFTGVSNWLKTGEISEIYGNGIVAADEVSRMDLHSTKLVVLSSCQNGMSEVVEDKGFYGMISALSAAGVQYVISNLWNTSDLCTPILMDAFYYQYIEKKQSPPVALNKAKHYLRNVTMRHLREQGWLDYLREIEKNSDYAGLLETYEKYSDRVRPFRNEEYWGGFVCYRCN